MYLGLDLSLRATGVCVVVDSTTYETAVLSAPDLIGVARLVSICNQLRAFIDRFGGPDAFELAAIENYAFAGVGKVFHLAELGGVIRDRLYTWGLEFIAVNPGHVKMFATGSGTADKAHIGNCLALTWGVDFMQTTWSGQKKNKPRPADWGLKDDHWRNDEADAYVLGNVAAYYSGNWDRSPTVEQDRVIASIKQDPQGVLTAAAKARNESKK